MTVEPSTVGVTANGKRDAVSPTCANTLSRTVPRSVALYWPGTILGIFMKSIYTLVRDIYDVVQTKDWFSPDRAGEFHAHVAGALNQEARIPSLRLSQMGPKCPCQLWHSIHTPELAEPYQPWAHIKFNYGHMLEAYVIQLAKAAGHEVTGEQDELILDGVVGHRDCVIDGCVVDVKSSSTLGFAKFKDGSIKDNDSFGYLDQLDGYVVASRNDPLVTNKQSGFLLAIDKTLGHLALYEHIAREERIRGRIRDYREIVSLARPPKCTCESVPDGASGNYRLGVTASYNPYKFQCHPHLRTFLYANGPRYLTKVIRKPDVTEVDRNGKIVYNG